METKNKALCALEKKKKQTNKQTNKPGLQIVRTFECSAVSEAVGLEENWA